MDFKERMIKELEELTLKIEKLGNYIERTPQESVSLEQVQLGAMIKYQEMLEKRILKLMK